MSHIELLFSLKHVPPHLSLLVKGNFSLLVPQTLEIILNLPFKLISYFQCISIVYSSSKLSYLKQ